MWIFGVKLVPSESRLKELSIDMWITKIEFKMRKLWPFKIESKFQTQALITLTGNRLKQGIGRKVVIFPIAIMKNTLKSPITIMNPSWKIVTPFLKPENLPLFSQTSFSLSFLSSFPSNPKRAPHSSHSPHLLP